MSIVDLARPEIVAMKPYASARSEAPGEGILLNANESPWPLIEDSLAGDSVDTLNRYPEPQHGELVARLADLYGLPESHVLLTRGSDDGIDLLVRVFCRAGQDAILDTPPSFGMYRIAAQIQGAPIVEVPRQPDSLELDVEIILAALRGKSPPRIVFLTSPANPTGDVMSPEDLESILEAALGRAIVVVDEAYAEFTTAQGFSSWTRKHENLVVLRTLSKGFASAGLRCGAVLAQAELIGLLRRVIPPYPLATPVLSLALSLLEPGVLSRQRLMLREIRRNKERLLEKLADRPFVRRIWPGEANFVLIRVDDAASLLEHCKASGIVIRAFPSAPLLKNCVRITVGSRAEITRLALALDAYSAGRQQSPTEARHG